MASKQFVHPAHVESEIRRLSDRLEELTEQNATFAVQAGEAEALHKAAFSRAWLEAGVPTQGAREHTATIRTATLYKDRLRKEAVYKSNKEALLTVRAQLDALRTISASLRAQT